MGFEFLYRPLARSQGMRHTYTALYFNGASKKSLHKPRANFGNMLFHIDYGLIIIYNFYVYIFYLELTWIFNNSLLGSKKRIFSKIFIISVYDC